jgi:multiple sugar transport system ATP-binding protein
VNLFVAGFIGEPPMNFIRATLQGGTIVIGNYKYDLAHVLDRKSLEKYEGKEIVFGFRPEAIDLHNMKNAYVIPAKVELTELLGDNTNVYVDIKGTKSILKIDPHDTPAMDSDIKFAIPLESVYLFDGKTEKNIPTTRR